MRFHSYWLLLTLLPYCESRTRTSINSNDSSFHHFEDDHRHETSPSPSSSTPNGPRFIGLDINGGMKCLLWSNPKTFMHPTLTALFSSRDRVGEDDGIDANADNISAQQAESTGKIKKSKEQQRGLLLTSLMPGAVFATTDYRFRKDRWYGVERIGTILRWHLPSSSHSRHDYGNFQKNNHEESDGASLNHSRKRRVSMPTTIEIAASRSLFSSKAKSRKEFFVPFVDSGSLRVGWQQHEETSEVGFGENRVDSPWFQLGFEQTSSDPFVLDGDFHTKNHLRNRNGSHPFHLRLFLPMIRRRLHFQWTSRWGKDDSGAPTREEDEMENRQWSSKHRRPNDDPWWMPQVSLDPSMGTLSSLNRYRNTFTGENDRRYWTEFKLRIRTTVPTILSSVAHGPMGPSDYDDDLQSASLRLDCSLMTDSGRIQRCQSPRPDSMTTARFETVLVPSFWMSSVTETARFGLIHEQNHGPRK